MNENFFLTHIVFRICIYFALCPFLIPLQLSLNNSVLKMAADLHLRTDASAVAPVVLTRVLLNQMLADLYVNCVMTKLFAIFFFAEGVMYWSDCDVDCEIWKAYLNKTKKSKILDRNGHFYESLSLSSGYLYVADSGKA